MKKYLALISAVFLLSAGFVFAAPVNNIYRSLIPEASNTYYIGTTTPSTLQWNGIYTKDLTVTGTCTGCSGASLPYYASTTIGDGTPIGGLTISGSGTTTGTLYAPNISINNAAPTLTNRLTITGATSDTGVLVTGVTTGTGVNVNQISTGTGLSATGLTTGKAVNCSYGVTAASANCILANTVVAMTADYTGTGLVLNASPGRNVAAAAARIHSGSIVNVVPIFSTSGALVSTLAVSGTTTVLSRILSNASSGGGSGVNATAPVVEISNKTLATNGVTDTSNLLALLQMATSSTGTVFTLNNAGSGNLATFTGTGNVGIGTSSPWRGLSVTGTVGFDGLSAGSGTSLCLSSSKELVTCTAAGGAAYPFQLAGNATSTLTQFNGGLTAFASSTIGAGSTGTGLTIFGGATTTGNALVQGTLTVSGNTTHTGTLTQTGLATFTNGFVSQASSTIVGVFNGTGTGTFGGSVASKATVSHFLCSNPDFTLCDLDFGVSTTTANLNMRFGRGTNVGTTNVLTYTWHRGDGTVNSAMTLNARTGLLTVNASSTINTGNALVVNGWANITGQAGIGTTTPWGQLSASSTSAFPTLAIEQKGAGASALFLGGNVGIGTTSPSSKLTVWGADTTSAVLGNFVNSASTTVFSIANNGVAVGTDQTNNWTGRVTPTRSFALTTGTTTAWTASTTGSAYSPYLVMPFSGTLRQVYCATDQSFVGVNVQVNGSNATPSYAIASTTVGIIPFTAGNTFTRGQKVLLNVGTTTTAATQSVSCTFDATETP